jgi:hypothetical protein
MLIILLLQAEELVPLPLLQLGDESAFWIEVLQVRSSG